MKKLLMISAVLISFTGSAQDFSKAEYFFDSDPGIGNGTSISLASTADPLTFTANIPTTSLTTGFHFLSIRVKQVGGPWGLFESRGFYISTATSNAANITAAEYFFDTDPGIRNGINIPVTPGATTNFTISLPATALLPGFHFLAIRTKGTDGKWGIFESRGFYISAATTNAANISKAEYFFDVDPGQGNATSLSVPSGAISNFTVSLPTTSLSPGFHFLAIRTKGADGKWGTFESRGFYISSETTDAANIARAEYFFDSDPGPGNATSIAIPSGATSTFTVSLPTTGLTPGFHFLGIRTKGTDGKWGLFESRGFYIGTQTTDAPNIVAAEYFFDTDPGEGNAQPLSVTPGAIINENFVIPITTNLPAGSHTLAIRVQTSDGRWSFKETGTFSVLANLLPTAIAGADQTLNFPTNAATLNGSASSDADGTISSFLWTKISGPAGGSIVNAGQAIATAQNLVPGVYAIELTVTDNNNTIDKDTLLITVPNQPPVADAGADKSITLPTNSTNLDGTASIDPDGTISTFSWVKISGPSSGTLSNANQSIATVSAVTQGTYKFGLTVTDNNGATDKDTVQLTVNPPPNVPPVAAAGPDQTTTLPNNTVTLNGSLSSDSDGSITNFSWAKISGPVTGTIINPNQSSTTVSNLSVGVYKFELTVTDNNSAIDKDTLQVTVNAAPNLPPDARAGTDQSITLPTNSVSLNGSLSSDPDGSITNFLWAKISGPSATINNPGQSITTISNLIAGIYKFTLTVTDNNGATNKDTLQVVVNPAPNQPPVADAGADQVLTLPVNTAILNAAASSDPDGNIISFNWSKVSGPASGVISNPNQSITLVNNLIAGVYVFELTISDNSGAGDKDTLSLTVNPAPVINNCPPVPVITMLDNLLVCNPSGDSYQWYKEGLKINGAISQVLEIDMNEHGIYAVEITDNNCTVRSADYVYLITDLEGESKTIEFYPNPFRDNILVVAPQEFNGTSLSFVDIVGKRVKTFTLRSSTNEISTEDLSAGMYYIFVDGKFIRKLQKL